MRMFAVVAAGLILAGCAQESDTGYTGNAPGEDPMTGTGAAAQNQVQTATSKADGATNSTAGAASGSSAIPPASARAGERVASDVLETNTPPPQPE